VSTGPGAARQDVISFAIATLAASRSHAFPVKDIRMAPCPFTTASLDGPPGPSADILKADLELAVALLLAAYPAWAAE
jgi:hypothetical protein